MIIELLDSVSFLFFTLILYFLSVLSKRFGEVIGIRKYYYIYYAGMLFTSSGSIMIGMSAEGFEYGRLLGFAFFSVGMTLGILASIKYWGWLLKEIIKG